MTIKIGDKLPNATVFEFFHEETEGCSLGPNKFEVEKELAGKTVAILALPGAYTPTCSAKHVPGFIAHFDAFKAKGVDEIWCISVNDAFVMGMWGKSLGAEGKVRPDISWYGRSFQPLFDAGQRRCGNPVQCGSTRCFREQHRRKAVVPNLKNNRENRVIRAILRHFYPFLTLIGV